MSNEYYRLAYERSVLLALVRMGVDHFLPDDVTGIPRKHIVCEEVPVNRKEVPSDEVHTILAKLERMAKKRELEMSKFQFKKMDDSDEEEEIEVEESNGTKQATGESNGGEEKPAEAAGQGAQKDRRRNRRPRRS